MTLNHTPWRLQLTRTREAKKWTRERLARATTPPLSASTISKIEAGKLNPTMSTVEAIAAALSCDVGLRPRSPELHTRYRTQVADDLVAKHRQQIVDYTIAVLETLFGPIDTT